jgi:hypothetical protein
LKETLFAIAYIFALFAIAGVVLYFRDRIEGALWKRKNPPEKLAAEWKEYQGQVQTPDWEFYADHLQRDVPDAIRDLFSNTEIIISGSAESCGEQTISRFGTIDEDNLLESKEWTGADIVAIAYNVFGDPIYLRPGRDETNAVFVTYHDGGDTEQIAADASEFVESIRLNTVAE